MGVGLAVKELWQRVTRVDVEAQAGERKTAVAPMSVAPYLAPYAGPGGSRSVGPVKATSANLRRFAEVFAPFFLTVHTMLPVEG